MVSVSVVMTTYNGEKYIIEQLDSIRLQTRQPDEVLIFDDVSTDSTFEIVSRYLVRFNLKSWRVYKNLVNKGWKKNFIDAMTRASGDYIFLSDQDDIWNIDKIESMTKIMDSNRNVNLLCGTSEILYSGEDERKTHRPFYSYKKKAFYLNSMWNGSGLPSKINKLLKGKKNYNGKVVKIPFESNIFNIQKQGCVMAVRKDFFEKYRKYWSPDCPHDSLIWFCAAMTDSLYYIDKPVIKYRHHHNNTGFVDTIGDGQTKRKEMNKIAEFIVLLNHFKKIVDDYDGKNKSLVQGIINEIIVYYTNRADFLQNRSLKAYVRLVNNKKIIGNRQLIFDLLLTFLT